MSTFSHRFPTMISLPYDGQSKTGDKLAAGLILWTLKLGGLACKTFCKIWGGIQWLGTFGIQPRSHAFFQVQEDAWTGFKTQPLSFARGVAKACAAGGLPDGRYPIDGFSRRLESV